MIQNELEKVEAKSATIRNRYIIMLRAGEDPLTFRSNADFKRYLGITGRRQGEVAKEYGPQEVANKNIIHVPKEIYNKKYLARFRWKGTSTRQGNRINRKASLRSKESAEQ